MTEQFKVVDRTENYTPAFRSGEGFLELWSVDGPDGKTIGVVRKHATSAWSARVYDGKHHSGFAKHRLLGDADTKGKAVDLILSFHTQRTSQDGQLGQAREIIASFLLWHDPAYKPGPSENLENIVQEARAFLWPDMFGGADPECGGQ
jgi:hypothetical protein